MPIRTNPQPPEAITYELAIATMAELADKLVDIQLCLEPLCRCDLGIPDEERQVISDVCTIVESVTVDALELLRQMGGWPELEPTPRKPRAQRFLSASPEP